MKFSYGTAIASQRFLWGSNIDFFKFDIDFLNIEKA